MAPLVLLTAALAASPVVRLQPGTAKPGDAVLVTITGVERLPEGTLGAYALDFLPYRGGYQALLGLSVDLKPQSMPLNVRLVAEGEERDVVGLLDIVDPAFHHDELKVAKKYTSPSKAAKQWMKDDQKAFDEAWSHPLEPRLFNQAFVWPRISRITAPFGDLRVFNGKKQSQHYGVDIDGEIGDDAFAANDGTVVMTRECYGSGNTVLLHHGAGLFTAYFHLSRIDVKNGDKVKQGDRLGLIGKTGRVTGPHLHWGAKVSGRWVDAESLIRLDFE